MAKRTQLWHLLQFFLLVTKYNTERKKAYSSLSTVKKKVAFCDIGLLLEWFLFFSAHPGERRQSWDGISVDLFWVLKSSPLVWISFVEENKMFTFQPLVCLALILTDGAWDMEENTSAKLLHNVNSSRFLIFFFFFFIYWFFFSPIGHITC